jgi:hypothetical protein
MEECSKQGRGVAPRWAGKASDPMPPARDQLAMDAWAAVRPIDVPVQATDLPCDESRPRLEVRANRRQRDPRSKRALFIPARGR